jgi:hypothetical protein
VGSTSRKGARESQDPVVDHGRDYDHRGGKRYHPDHDGPDAERSCVCRCLNHGRAVITRIAASAGLAYGLEGASLNRLVLAPFLPPSRDGARLAARGVKATLRVRETRLAPLWRPAPAIAVRFERAPSSRVRVHDPSVRVRLRDIGHSIRRWRDGYGRRRQRRDESRWRRRVRIRCVGINDLRMRAGHTDQRRCCNHSRQHLHCFRLLLNFATADFLSISTSPQQVAKARRRREMT